MGSHLIIDGRIGYSDILAWLRLTAGPFLLHISVQWWDEDNEGTLTMELPLARPLEVTIPEALQKGMALLRNCRRTSAVELRLEGLWKGRSLALFQATRLARLIQFAAAADLVPQARSSTPSPFEDEICGVHHWQDRRSGRRIVTEESVIDLYEMDEDWMVDTDRPEAGRHGREATLSWGAIVGEGTASLLRLYEQDGGLPIVEVTRRLAVALPPVLEDGARWLGVTRSEWTGAPVRAA
jgi:hypothetical protein